jgi:hypothetical protein
MLNTVHDLRIAARRPFAWPGGYPTYFVCDDGAALCHDCVAKERRNKLRTGWRVVALDINYDDDSLYCEHCYVMIESAHGE